MSDKLAPWATRPFELIVHAEIHYRRGSDYDRRLALISYDNSIEVSIATYLSLHPSQRGNRPYEKKDVERWKHNFHSKLDFFCSEIKKRGLPEYKTKAEIVWYHDQRNEHYHGGGSAVPEQKTLDEIREVSLWIFSVLFECGNIETILESEVNKRNPNLRTIPDGLAVPKEPITEENALTIASLVGKWDEANENDREIIRRLADGF
jgi:hypothetical protein